MSTDNLYSTTGIYLITNTVTGAVYVGSTTLGFSRRWGLHLSDLRSGKHPNVYLQNAWNKYGEASFEFSIAEPVEDVSVLLEREQEWINRYFSLGKTHCYNLTPTAGSNKGWSPREETIQRRVLKTTGQKRSEETRRRMSKAGKRRAPITEETRRKLIAGRIGRKMPAAYVETRRKTYEGFVSPDGVEYRNITNIQVFAAEHGLRTSALCELDRGKHLTVKGWRRIGSTGRKVFNFIAPNGTHYRDITNLARFAKEHNVSDRSLGAVHNGKLLSYKGWMKG